MIRVQIDNEPPILLSDLREGEFNQQIIKRKEDGKNVCVKVNFDCPGVKLSLATPGCTSSGGGGRAPNRDEQEIFDLWSKRGLNDSNFTGGNVIAFLKQAEKLVKC